MRGECLSSSSGKLEIRVSTLHDRRGEKDRPMVSVVCLVEEFFYRSISRVDVYLPLITRPQKEKRGWMKHVMCLC